MNGILMQPVNVFLNYQMEKAVSQFDAELRLLRQEKLHLYPQLKLADLRQLTLYQELLLLKEFERRKDCGLQERLKERIKEEKFMVVGSIQDDFLISLHSGISLRTKCHFLKCHCTALHLIRSLLKPADY